MHENDLAKLAVNAAFKIHNSLGPGLLESAYEVIMQYELEKCGVAVRRQVPISIKYENVIIDEGYKADLVLNEKIILELKAVEKDNPLYQRQLLTYLKLADKRLGLVINFGMILIKDGIHRVANGLQD